MKVLKTPSDSLGPFRACCSFGADPAHPVMPLRVSKAFYGLVQSPRCWFNDVSSKMLRQGWKVILADRCIFCLYDTSNGDLIGIAGLHVDDFLVAGDDEHPEYKAALKTLQSTYKWGKWQEKEIDFAGCRIVQQADMSLRVDQQSYIDKWLEEIQLPKQRMSQLKSALTSQEVSMLRGAIGTIAWKSAQTGPHFQAEAGLLLSEVPRATINTIVKCNKLIREIRRESGQCLKFPVWRQPWNKMAIITWCDAGQANRPDKSSTLGHISGITPEGFLTGSEEVVAVFELEKL